MADSKEPDPEVPQFNTAVLGELGTLSSARDQVEIRRKLKRDAPPVFLNGKTLRMAATNRSVVISDDQAGFAAGQLVWLLPGKLAMGPPLGYITFNPAKMKMGRAVANKQDPEFVAIIRGLGVNTVFDVDDMQVEMTTRAWKAGGVKYFHLPLQDFATPDREWLMRAMPVMTEALLTPGKVAYLHCGTGHGRTCMVAMLLMQVLFTLTPEEAVRHVCACFLKKDCRCGTCTTMRDKAGSGDITTPWEFVVEVQPEKVHQRKFVLSEGVATFLTQPLHQAFVANRVYVDQRDLPDLLTMPPVQLYMTLLHAMPEGSPDFGRGVYNKWGKNRHTFSKPDNKPEADDPHVASLIVRGVGLPGVFTPAAYAESVKSAQRPTERRGAGYTRRARRRAGGDYEEYSSSSSSRRYLQDLKETQEELLQENRELQAKLKAVTKTISLLSDAANAIRF